MPGTGPMTSPASNRHRKGEQASSGETGCRPVAIRSDEEDSARGGFAPSRRRRRRSLPVSSWRPDLMRRLLAPRWLAAHVFVLAVCVTCVLLGFWQVSRLQGAG